MGLAHFDGEDFRVSIEKGVQLIADRLVLDDLHADAEVVLHVLLDQLHLLRVNLVAFLLDLLHVAHLVAI